MKKIIPLILALSFVVPMLACQDEGPAEKAGKKIDEAAETVKDEAQKIYEEHKE